VTFSLTIGAAIIWVGFGILFGFLSAIKVGSLTDRVLTVVALVGISMPVFLLASIFLYFLTYKIELFPSNGYEPLSNPWEWFTHLLLPWISLAILSMGFYSRVLRSSMLDVMSEDYVRTARAKGLTERRVMLRHALRTSLITFVSLFGLDFGALVGGGALLTEVVFGLHGIGKLTFDSLQNLDLPVILATVIYAAFFVVLANAVVDLVYAWLDPRVRRA
jgi:peptide/nickel transport system permease protein